MNVFSEKHVFFIALNGEKYTERVLNIPTACAKLSMPIKLKIYSEARHPRSHQDLQRRGQSTRGLLRLLITGETTTTTTTTENIIV